MRASGFCRLFLAVVFGTLLLASNAARPAAASPDPTQHASNISSHSLIDAGGHWLVASDGGIFGFGATSYYGSMGGHPLNSPIVGMVSLPQGHGFFAPDNCYYNYTNGNISGKYCAAVVTGTPGALLVYSYPGPAQVPSQLVLGANLIDPGYLFDFRVQPQYDPVFKFIDFVRVPNDATQPYQYYLCDSAPSGGNCFWLTRSQIVSYLEQSTELSTTLDALYNYDPSLDSLPTSSASSSSGSTSSGSTSSGSAGGINLTGIEAGQVTDLSALQIGLSESGTSCTYGCSTLTSDGTEVDVLGQNARPAPQTPSYPQTPVPPPTSGLPQP